MKALLISIRPQWVKKILNLIKKDEIRKGTRLYKAINKLIAEQGVAPTFIYCTKNGDYLMKKAREDGYITCMRSIQPKQMEYSKSVLNGKVLARFNATAEEIKRNEIGYYYCDRYVVPYGLQKWSCLTQDELHAYLQGEKGTAIHINDLEIFDKPKEISEFRYAVCPKTNCEYCEYNRTVEGDLYCTRKSLTRAPQSWYYIEI